MHENKTDLQRRWNLGRFSLCATNQYAARDAYDMLCAMPNRTERSGTVLLESGERVRWIELGSPDAG